VEGHDQKNFPALRAGSVPPLSLRTGAPHFQIRSSATAPRLFAERVPRLVRFHTQQFARNVSLRGYATWYTSNMAVTGVDRMTSLPHHEFLTYVTLIISLGLFGSQLARNNSILTADFLVVVKLAKSMPNCPTYSIVCSHSSTFVYDRLLQ